MAAMGQGSGGDRRLAAPPRQAHQGRCSRAPTAVAWPAGRHCSSRDPGHDGGAHAHRLRGGARVEVRGTDPRRAEYLGVLDRSELERALARNRGRAGAGPLIKILTRHQPGSTRTRSPLEEAFLALVRRAGLPQPLVNSALGPYAIDFLWRDQRIAVETDGRRAHERAAARERDYRRDSWLHANGYRPLRFTWEQVHHRPTRCSPLCTPSCSATPTHRKETTHQWRAVSEGGVMRM